MAGVSTRTVKTLRGTGLIEKTNHSRALGMADEYRLIMPGPDMPVLRVRPLVSAPGMATSMTSAAS